MAAGPVEPPSRSLVNPSDRAPRLRAESGQLSREVAALVAAWGRGARPTAAEVLERCPDIDDEAGIRLIYEESCLRREAGLEVDTSEFVGRYPRWGAELRALFDCDRLLRASNPAACAAVGDTLGPFLLVGELGRGASGRTYLATDPRLADRPVVLKVIADDQDEHLALAPLQHTHIVPLFSEHNFPERGLRGLCMPYLGGASLAQILESLAGVPYAERSGRLLIEILDRRSHSRLAPPCDGPFRRGLAALSYSRAIAWIAACLADALQHAHARGVIHMDVKPSNVLITADGQPMLLDFHLARAPIKVGEWVADRLGGTPGWMSPEQETTLAAASDGLPAPADLDGRSDLFALGLLLREALGLGSPVVGERRGRGAARFPPGVSVALVDIVRKCLALNPRDRYTDASSLAEDLRRELEDLPLRGVRNRSPVERARKWRRRHPGARAWGVAVTAVLVGGAVAIAASEAVYRQRVSQIEAALDDGRRQRLAGRWDTATHLLERVRPSAAYLPFGAGLRRTLDEELRIARRGQVAQELHRLAEQIRYRYGMGLPPIEEALSLDRLCRAIWGRRGELLYADGGPTIDRRSEEWIRTDLAEIAAVGFDLRIRLASTGEADDARRDAMRLLDEAEALLGPSLSLDLRRSELVAVSGQAACRFARPREPRSAREHYEMGRHHLRSRRFEEACEEFRRVLDLRPQDFWSNFYEGLCSYRLGRVDDAINGFRTCIALQPASAACYYNRGQAFAGAGRVDDARRDFTRAVQLDPDLAVAFLSRGILAYERAQFSAAIEDFRQGLHACRDRDTLGQLHYNLALSLIARGDRCSALDHIEEAIHLGCPGAARLRGEQRSRRGRE